MIIRDEDGEETTTSNVDELSSLQKRCLTSWLHDRTFHKTADPTALAKLPSLFLSHLLVGPKGYKAADSNRATHLLVERALYSEVNGPNGFNGNVTIEQATPILQYKMNLDPRMDFQKVE